MIERAAEKEGDERAGRNAANAQELMRKSRVERQTRREREANRWAWIRHYNQMRRSHLELALEARAKARALEAEMADVL